MCVIVFVKSARKGLQNAGKRTSEILDFKILGLVRDS